MYREITTEDIPNIFEVRAATDENNLSLEELHSMGITEHSVCDKICGTYKGWLYETDDQIVGFAMGNRETGELWVIAILPEYINKGIGSGLLQLVENWLFESGCKALWLTTDMNTQLRAYSFYRKNGWEDDRIEDGLRYMVKKIK
jgi:ribosomal protein S18 acetylase RimI-like enzyme